MSIIISSSPDAPKAFPFEERIVRHRLGLTDDEFRALRKTHLTGGLDFAKHKKRLYLSAKGVDAIFTAAGQPAPEKRSGQQDGINPDDPAAPKKAPAQKEPLLVVRTDLANKHILLACPAGQDIDNPRTTLRVRVGSTVNFQRGMEIPAVRVDGYTDLYDLARALPRKKGAW